MLALTQEPRLDLSRTCEGGDGAVPDDPPARRQHRGRRRAPAFHCGSLGNLISVMLAEHDRTASC